MIEPAKLQRAPSNDAWCAVVGAEWNKMCDRVEALQFEVAPPLTLERDPAGGRLLLINIPLLVMPLRLTDTETTGGFYKARTLYGSVDIASTATFTMPLGLTEQPADDSLVLWPAEAGGSAHALSTSGSAAYGAGLFVGMTKETTPRKALIWISGGSGASVSYAKVSSDWSPSTGNGNQIAAHPCTAAGGSVDTSTTLHLYLAVPFTAHLQFSPLKTNDIVAFMASASLPNNGSQAMDGILLPTPQLPLASNDYDVLQKSGSALTFDYVRMQ